MLLLFKNTNYDNVIVFDAEYNEGDLIQFSGIMFRKVKNDIFQISKSINLYVDLPYNKTMNRFIEKFTGITDDFLSKNGLELTLAREKINEFLEKHQKERKKAEKRLNEFIYDSRNS